MRYFYSKKQAELSKAVYQKALENAKNKGAPGK